jgi:hypothetical protein
MDAYVGGLAERPIIRGAIPPTFSKLIEDYFTRIRAADRFYYENPGVLSESELKEVQGRSLSDMVRDHTDIDQITDNMFGMQGLVDSYTCTTDGGNAGGGNGTNSGGDSAGSYSITSGFDVEWQVVSATNRIRFKLISTLVPKEGWLGIGIGGNKMAGADFHIGYFEGGTFKVLDGHSVAGGNVDTDDENSLTIGDCSYEGDILTIQFERPLTATSSEQDAAIVQDQSQDVIFAYGATGFPSYHGFASKFVAQLTFWSASGAAPAPSPAPTGAVDTKMLSLLVHGASMSLIWLIFIPLGTFFIRFRKG